MSDLIGNRGLRALFGRKHDAPSKYVKAMDITKLSEDTDALFIRVLVYNKHPFSNWYWRIFEATYTTRYLVKIDSKYSVAVVATSDVGIWDLPPALSDMPRIRRFLEERNV